MADLSNKELLIPVGTFLDMERRVNAFIKKNKKNPALVFINGLNTKDTITFNRFLDMKRRVDGWYIDNPKKVLNNVWIKKPVSTPNVLLPSAGKEVIPIINIKGKSHKPKTFTAFYDLMSGYGYGYYYNDVYSLSQEIKRLSEGKVLNCTDFSQFGAWFASQFKKNGKTVYTTRYGHINCKSGGGHVILEIKGGEFKDKWVRVDIAARADKKSRVYKIGDYWCKSGKFRGYNEAWIMVNNGKMT